MDKRKITYCPVCGESVDIPDVDMFYVDCKYCGTEFDAASAPYPTEADWERFTRRASADIEAVHNRLTKVQSKLDRLVDTRLKAAIPPHLHQAVGLIDVCPNCGGSMIGDGITLTRHCEQADLPEDREADSAPIYCAFDAKYGNIPDGLAEACPACKRGKLAEQHPGKICEGDHKHGVDPCGYKSWMIPNLMTKH